jgi:hypothetical protein
MIDGLILVILGAWCLLVGLGKVRVSKSPQAGAAWLQKWGLAFRIGGPVLVLAGLAKIVVGLVR